MVCICVVECTSRMSIPLCFTLCWCCTTGYDGVFTPKESGIEGVALFWRASRYRMVAREDVSYCALIKQALENKTPPTCVAPLLPMIQVT